MVFFKEIDRFFPVFLLGGVISGFAFPSFFQPYEPYVIYIIMFIMFLLYLKVDALDILTHMKNPILILYVTFFNLILLPIITFFLFKNTDTELHSALVLLAALPAGVTAATFTDIMKGRGSLSLTITLVTNLLATMTIPFVFFILFNTNLTELVNIQVLFFGLLKVMLIPLLIAKLFKYVFIKKWIKNLRDYYNPIILILMSFMIMCCVSSHASYILGNYQSLLKILGILFLLFFMFQLLGYFSIFWKAHKGIKLAVSTSTMNMNNVLGIVLSIGFFPPMVTTIMILSFIPWTTIIILKHWYKKYLP